MNKVIEALIAEELARANSIHRDRFSSMHEGESVIMEEIEEAREEADSMIFYSNDLWLAVRARDEDRAKENIKLIKSYATEAITELVQVAAMCDKWELSF